MQNLLWTSPDGAVQYSGPKKPRRWYQYDLQRARVYAGVAPFCTKETNFLIAYTMGNLFFIAMLPNLLIVSYFIQPFTRGVCNA